MVWRQLAAAIPRSAAFSSTWTSFSASPKVAVETSGPAPAPVPKAGGIPAGGLVAGSCVAVALAAIAAPAHPMVAKKSLRDSDILPPETVPHCIASGQVRVGPLGDLVWILPWLVLLGRLGISLRRGQSFGQLRMLGENLDHAILAKLLAPLAALFLQLGRNLWQRCNRFLTERRLVELDQTADLLVGEGSVINGHCQVEEMIHVGFGRELGKEQVYEFFAIVARRQRIGKKRLDRLAHGIHGLRYDRFGPDQFEQLVNVGFFRRIHFRGRGQAGFVCRGTLAGLGGG